MKHTVYGKEVREEMFKGVAKLSTAVKSTLGPAGRNVIIKISREEPAIITKDGVTVANAFSSNNPIEQVAIEAIQKVSQNSDNMVGDGTTTATVLAEYILANGIGIDDDRNLLEVKKGIDIAAIDVLKALDEYAVPCDSDEMLSNVAMISSNGDEEITKCVVEAFKVSGDQGIVNIVQSKTGETFVNSVVGMVLPTGYKSKGFIKDYTNELTDLQEPIVFSTNESILRMTDNLAYLFEKCSEESIPLLIVCKDMATDIEQLLIQKFRKGAIDVCVCKAPGFGHEQKDLLRDIGVTLGKSPFIEDDGLAFDDLDLDEVMEYLPKAKKVRVTENSMTIEGYGDFKKEMDERADSLRLKIDDNLSTYEKSFIQSRISRLSDGIAFIHIGANSEFEAEEKRHRIQDALYAVKSANDLGVVPGGGATLLTIGYELSRQDRDLSEDKEIGYNILINSLGAPFDQICINSGKESFTKEEDMNLLTNVDFGYDAKNECIVNMMDSNIIDPVKVTKAAISNSVSISGLLFTTECVIVDSDSFKKHSYNVE